MENGHRNAQRPGPRLRKVSKAMSEVSALIRPPIQRSGPVLKTAEDVYQRTLRLFNENVKPESPQRKWLETQNSLQDVQLLVSEAKKIYEKKADQSKIRKWLSNFSSRFMYYSSVMDVLAQHHPEYLSLAWGTVKLLFILVLNHEELITQLAKALSKIGDVLPRLDLTIGLYRTSQMDRHIEELYAELIAFFDRALKWYKEGKIMHALRSFTNPYSLRFKDLVDKIDEHTRRIDSLAATLAQVEMRRMHLLLEKSQMGQEEMHGMLVDLKQMMITNHTITSSQLIDTYESTCQIQLAKMIEATSKTALSDPTRTLRFHQSMRARRAGQNTIEFKNVTPNLQQWATSKESSLLVIKGSLPTRLAIRDLIVDIIGVVQRSNFPIIWALEARNDEIHDKQRSVQILKHLVMQLLQLNPSAVSTISRKFNIARLQTARNEAQWFEILAFVLVGLPPTFIIIHTDIFGQPGLEDGWIKSFYNLLVKFIQDNKQLRVKVAVVNYRPLLLTSYFPANEEHLSIILDKARNNAPNRKQQGRKAQGSSRRSLQVVHRALVSK